MQADPAVIDFLVSTARKLLAPKRILLFGSRARGDARERSDYDIAIEGSDKGAGERWAAFLAEIEENAPTLLNIDLVDLSSAGRDLREQISREGITLFPREAR